MPAAGSTPLPPNLRSAHEHPHASTGAGWGQGGETENDNNYNITANSKHEQTFNLSTWYR